MVGEGACGEMGCLERLVFGAYGMRTQRRRKDARKCTVPSTHANAHSLHIGRIVHKCMYASK